MRVRARHGPAAACCFAEREEGSTPDRAVLCTFYTETPPVLPALRRGGRGVLRECESAVRLCDSDSWLSWDAIAERAETQLILSHQGQERGGIAASIARWCGVVVSCVCGGRIGSDGRAFQATCIFISVGFGHRCV